MEIVFDRGSRDSPKGHALLYFRSSSDPDEVWATYLVILPISVDVSKYVPPFLMNQMGELGPKDLSAFAFPPAPERLESYAALETMAAKRDDDILFAGSVNPTDVTSAMMTINEVVQQYAEVYAREVSALESPSDETDEVAPGVGVNEVLYGLMSEGDKLEELTKMVGRLRFAVEGSDAGQVKEVEDDIGLLAKHLPDNHNIPQLVQAVKSDDARSDELADLYLRRCYFLVHEEYTRLADVERRLTEMEGKRPAE